MYKHFDKGTLIVYIMVEMILDSTAGKRMMWFQKNYEETIYMDIKREVKPTIVADFRALPFQNEVFDLVVFDPPQRYYGNGIFYRKWGNLRSELIIPTLYKASRELFRVLKTGQFLILKWCTVAKELNRILTVFPYKPLFGQRTSGKKYYRDTSQTYWVTFQKIEKKIARAINYKST